MDYDKILLNIFFSRTNKEFNGNKFSEYKKRNYPNIQKYLLNRFSDTEGEKASLYRIKYNINKIPTCKTCGAPLKIVLDMMYIEIIVHISVPILVKKNYLNVNQLVSINMV